MGRVLKHRRWLAVIAVLVVFGLAAGLGLGGCAARERVTERVSTTYAGPIYGAPVTTAAAASEDSSAAMPPVEGLGTQTLGDTTVGLTVLQRSSGQKVISDGRVEIEVKSGDFQNAFSQALLIADRYGGYLVSSTSQASGEEGGLKSGTIAIRVPAASFDNALADAGKIGEVKNREVQTQDVTEEYVDLQARITNAKAHVQALLTLLAKAKTVDEVLQVQQVLTAAQQELEQLEGRQRFLDEHTDYSTLTLVIYEAGVLVTPSGAWGVTDALKDGLHNLVDAFNAIVRGLGILVPVLVILAIVAYVVYRLWRAAVRRRRAIEAARVQPYPQGWGGPGNAAAPQPQAAAPAGQDDVAQG